MIYPVPIHKGYMPEVSSSFRSPSRPTHDGVDIMYKRDDAGPQMLPVYAKRYFMPNGVPVLAILDGVVQRSMEIGTGGYIVIDHPGGLRSQYMHLRNRRVKTGDRVKAGQNIADISHNPSGYQLNHLHFQIRRNGRLIDPEPVIIGAQRVKAPWGLAPRILIVAAAAIATYKVLS